MALTVGKLTRTKTTPSGGAVDLEDAPAGAAVANVSTTNLPADNSISGLSIGAAYNQAEIQALRAKCENLRDALADANTTINALAARFRVTGGNGLIAD